MEVPAKFRPVLVDFSYWLLAFIVMATSTFLVSCSGGGGTNTVTTVTTTSTTTITPTVANALDIINTPTSVSADSDITITAYARYNGQAVAGETIYFVIDPNNSSSSVNGLNQTSAVTAGNGRATVTFTAGVITGVTDTVTVTSTTETDSIDITVNPLPADSVVISTTKAELPAITSTTGENRALIEAVVTAGGSPIELLDVSFTATAGTLCDSATAPGAACDDALAGVVLVAQTDGDGKASVILQSSTSLGSTTVTAQTPNLESGSVDVDFIAGPAGLITLIATPSNITADNGNSTSEITALVTDTAGHIIADTDNQGVTFEITGGSAGTGGLGDLVLPADNDTVVGGLASTTYTTIGFATGTVDIEATAGGVSLEETGLILLVAQTVSSIELDFPSGNTLTADGTSWIQVIATIVDTDLNPIFDQTVTFETNEGELDSVPTFDATPGLTLDVDTNASGIATAYLESTTNAGEYLVTVTSSGKVDSGQVVFEAGTPDDTESSLDVSALAIPINGGTATVTFEGLDENLNPIEDGTVVTFTADEGVFSDQTTTTGGIATATITSNLFVGDVDLYAMVPGLTPPGVTTSIEFTDNPSINPNSIVLDVNPTTIPLQTPSTGSQSIIIEATVNDTDGTPIIFDCPDNIEFEIIAGPTDALLDSTAAIGSDITKTTVDGVASVALTAGVMPGTVQVEVRATQDTQSCTDLAADVTTNTTVTIASGPAEIINLLPESDILDLPGNFLGQIFNAQVNDAYGNPVQDGTPIRFYLYENFEGSVCQWGATGEGVDVGCYNDSVAVNGVARTLLSYHPSFRWATYTLTAETEFGAVSDTYLPGGDSGEYLAAAPVSITVTLPQNPIGLGDQDITVIAEYKDKYYPFTGRTLTFSASDASVNFDGNATVDEVTDVTGKATIYSLDDVAPNCSDTRIVTITAAENLTPYFGSADLTITGTEPIADFTSENPAGTTFQFTNESDEPAGYTYTYAWTFGDAAAGTSALENPSYTYAGAESGNTLIVTLTVTSSAPGACSDIAVGSVDVP